MRSLLPLSALVCLGLSACASYTSSTHSYVKPTDSMAAVCLVPLQRPSFTISILARWIDESTKESAREKVDAMSNLYRTQIPLQLSARLKQFNVTSEECPKDTKSVRTPQLVFTVIGASVDNPALGLWKTDLTIRATLMDVRTQPSTQWTGTFRTGNMLNSFVAPDEQNVASFVDSVIQELKKEGWVGKSRLASN